MKNFSFCALPTNSLETAIDKNNYESYVPSIPKSSVESEKHKAPYKQGKSADSRGCPNATNTSKHETYPKIRLPQ